MHPSLLSCVEPLESQQVRALLKRLGVHELEPQELLEQHIYPSIRSNKWKVPYCVKWISDIISFCGYWVGCCPALSWASLSLPFVSRLRPCCGVHHQTKPEAVVVSYLVFIKQHSTSSQEYADAAVPVLTSRGLLCPASDRVHFSPEYNNIDLPKCLPGREKTTHFPQAVEHNGFRKRLRKDILWTH